MAFQTVTHDTDDALRRTGATDVLVYRRASGGRFVLTSPAVAAAREDLLLDDEPVVAAAVRYGVRRVVSERPRELCAGYVGRAAAVVAVDVDVVVILGRRDGCLAGVSDVELITAARSAATAPVAA